MKSPMAVFLMLLVASGIASAQSPDELARIYRAYIAAVKRGNFASITALNSARVRKEISTEYNSPGDRRNLLEMLREITPDLIEPLAATPVADGQKATLKVMATKKIPLAMQKKHNAPPEMKREMAVEFVKETAAWKVERVNFAAQQNQPAEQPREITKVANLDMGTRSDYKDSGFDGVGGPILRVERQAAGTVLVIGLSEREVAAFVPAELMSPKFVPGAAVMMDGDLHQTDDQKFWAVKVKLLKN